jgi:hypothetical protein
VDLREIINQTKSPEASPWKSFHETHFNTLYFQHLQLPHSKADVAEFLWGASTPCKLKLV